MHCICYFLVTGEAAVYQSTFGQPENEASSDKTVQSMLQHHRLELAEVLKNVHENMLTIIVTQCCDTFRK
jgi:hypothetical protein